MSSDSNPPRTLKSLWHYAHCQEGLIRPLLKPEDLYFRQAPFPAWVQLHSSAWGKNPDSLDTTEPVIRGPDTIDNTSILPDVVPSHCKVMLKPNPLGKCWRFGAERFLIRSEYEEAEEYLLSGFDQEAPGVVITGQPGIGKTVFLLRTLLRRLAYKLPTILQFKSSYALLFHEGGVKEFGQLGRHDYGDLESKVGPLGRIWALVDSNDDLFTPSSLFKDSPFFVVLAASARHTRNDWARERAFRFFYMELWSFSEVLQVRSLIKPALSEEKLWHMHRTYGASPRDLFAFAHTPELYEEVVIDEIRKLSVDGLARLFRWADTASDSCCYLSSTGPSPTDRARPEVKFSSPYIFRECCRRILRDDIEQLRSFHDLLRNKQSTTAFAARIRGYHPHQFLQEGGDIDLFTIFANEETKRTHELNPRLPEEGFCP